MKLEILSFPRVWLASLCLGALSFSAGLGAAEKAPAPAPAPAVKEKAAPKAEAAAYEAIRALKPGKGDAELAKLAPAFLEKYPASTHLEEVARLSAEALMRRKEWKGALDCYVDVATRFPKSADIDRYKFQTAICRYELGEVAAAELLLQDFLKSYPASALKEEATYRLAVACFTQNKYRETLIASKNYLRDYPAGPYAGAIIYQLAYIDYNDKAVDQSENIIDNLDAFIARNPNDAAVGALHRLLGDTWLKRKLKSPAGTPAAAKETQDNEDKALDHYRQAALSPTNKTAEAAQSYKAAVGLLTKRGDSKALAGFQADYRKQLEVRAEERSK